MKGRQNMAAMVSDAANSTVKKSPIVHGYINEHDSCIPGVRTNTVEFQSGIAN